MGKGEHSPLLNVEVQKVNSLKVNVTSAIRNINGSFEYHRKSVAVGMGYSYRIYCNLIICKRKNVHLIKFSLDFTGKSALPANLDIIQRKEWGV